MSRSKVSILTLLVATSAIASAGSAYALDHISNIKTNNSQNTAPKFISVNSDEKVTLGAKDFINGIAERGIGFLANEELTEEQREKEFRKLLQESFDMKTIGRFALGRYWKTSTDKEKKEYLKLFEEMIVNVYSRRFSDYNGHKLEVQDATASGNADTIVRSEIVPSSGPKIKVEWRVRYKDGKYKVVDIIVEKVSMSLTQRSDFASVIQRGGGQVEVLLAHLRQEEK